MSINQIQTGNSSEFLIEVRVPGIGQPWEGPWPTMNMANAGSAKA
jgi:hypothetical protein